MLLRQSIMLSGMLAKRFLTCGSQTTHTKYSMKKMSGTYIGVTME
jgi:hypothetical protein